MKDDPDQFSTIGLPLTGSRRGELVYDVRFRPKVVS